MNYLTFLLVTLLVFQDLPQDTLAKKKVIVVVPKPTVDKVFSDSLAALKGESKELTKKLDSLLEDDSNTDELKTMVNRLQRQNARLKRILYSLPTKDLQKIENDLEQKRDTVGTIKKNVEPPKKNDEAQPVNKKRGWLRRIFGNN